MDSQSLDPRYDTVDIRGSPELSQDSTLESHTESPEDPTRGPRGPRGRRGPPGPAIESCVVLLKPGHPEYFIRSEADVAILTGDTVWPKVHMPKIESRQQFDCEYLTAYLTRARLKIINQGTSMLTISSAPDDVFESSDGETTRKYQIKPDETVIFYGIDNRWYIDHQVKVYRSYDS